MSWFRKKSAVEIPVPVEFGPEHYPLIDAAKAAICPNDHIFIPTRSEFVNHGCPCGEKEFVRLADTPLIHNKKKARETKPVPFHEFLRKRAANQ